MLLIDIKGLDQRLLDDGVVRRLNAVRTSEGRREVGIEVASCWEVEVESALDRALRNSDLLGMNADTRINIEFGRWRRTRAQRVCMIARDWMYPHWTREDRAAFMMLVYRTVGSFLPKDWCLDMIIGGFAEVEYLHARAGASNEDRQASGAERE